MKGWIRPKTTISLVLFVFGFLAVRPAAATIRYEVSVAHPEQHIFHVSMTVPDVHEHLVVQLPAWNALYQIRDFAYHLSGFRAVDAAARPVAASRVDKQTWRIFGDGAITLQYEIYWDDAGPFNSQLNPAHAFVNLAMALFYSPERRGEDVCIVFADLPPAWRIAVELPKATVPVGESGVAFVAPNYDALVDAPVEMGSFEEFRITGVEPPVSVVIHGDSPLNPSQREQVNDTIRRIVSYETQLMGGAPYREYLFIYHVGRAAAGSGGGMEHANSTAIYIDNLAGLPGVTAHEFFHAWNVKRIRPASLEPVDYTREQWTRALWFAEGVTSTYGAYTLTRTGIWGRQQFYDDLALQITELESRPARRWMSAEEASLDAWLEKYPFYRRPDSSISYYNKGQLLGVMLDVLIRDATDNRASLDDVLRALNEDFARRGRFYRDTEDICAEAERIAGRNLGEFFARYVSGTEEVPFADLLMLAGLILKAEGGGRAEFGFFAGRGPDGTVAVQIEPGSAAAQAGLREGDVLVALNGTAFPRNGGRWLREHRPGETVRLRFRREGNEREISYALSERAERAYAIGEAASPTEKQSRIREGLLRGTTSAPGR